MEIVLITFATADSMYRFTYIRGHRFGQLEGITGDHVGERHTVNIEEVRDLVQKGDSPTLRGLIGFEKNIRIKEITEVVKNEVYVRQPSILINEVPV